MKSPSEYVSDIEAIAEEYWEKAKSFYDSDVFDDARDSFYDDLEDRIAGYQSGELDVPSGDELTMELARYMDEESSGSGSRYRKFAATLDDDFEGFDDLSDEYESDM